MPSSKAARRGIRTEDRLVYAINTMDELGKAIVDFLEKSLNQKFTKCYARKREDLVKADIEILCNDTSILFSVKEFDVKADYNHIERNYVDVYRERWSIPQDVYKVLKLYVGEVDINGNPISLEVLENEAKQINMSVGKFSKRRRKLLNQLDAKSRQAVVNFFKSNRDRILRDIFIGKEDIKFFIIARRERDEVCYYILPTEDVLKTYGSGTVEITKRGNLSFYKITVQRKGGDHQTTHGWVNKTASHLQFKISPSLCIKNLKPVFCEKTTIT